MSAALVEPPVAATTLAAFTNESIVTISLGLIFFSNKFITLPLFSPYAFLSSVLTAGGIAEFIGAKPTASEIHAIVFAVN